MKPRTYRLMIQDGDDDPKPWTVPCTLDQVKGELFRRWFGILVDGRRTTRIEMDPSDAPCHEFAVSYGRGRGRPRGLVWVWVEEDR